MRNERWHLAVILAICALFAWFGMRGRSGPAIDLTTEQLALGWLPRDATTISVVRPAKIPRDPSIAQLLAGMQAPLVSGHIPPGTSVVVCGTAVPPRSKEEQCNIVIADGVKARLPEIGWTYNFTLLPGAEPSENDRRILRRDAREDVTLLSTRDSLLDEMAARMSQKTPQPPPHGLRAVDDDEAVAWGRCTWGSWALHCEPSFIGGCALQLRGTPEFIGWSTRMFMTVSHAGNRAQITRSDPNHATVHFGYNKDNLRDYNWWVSMLLTHGQSFAPSPPFEPAEQR